MAAEVKARRQDASIDEAVASGAFRGPALRAPRKAALQERARLIAIWEQV